MNKFDHPHTGQSNQYHQFNLSNNYSNFISSSSFIDQHQQNKMNNFWCQDVPDNMPAAFAIPPNLNASANVLFRFAANQLNSSPANSSFNVPNCSNNDSREDIKDLSFLSNSSFISDCTNTPNKPDSILQNHWKTINNLSTASNLIGPYKRKSLPEDDDLVSFQPPTKQNATEEKVIGEFNKLCIDEEFEDSNEFISPLNTCDDEIIDADEINNCSDDLIEFETTDSILNRDDVKFELCEDVQNFWDTDDVITKLVKQQRNKDSKALVIWQPRCPIISLNESNNDDVKKTTKIVDQTDQYTVYSESDEDDTKDNEKNDKIEIIELDDDLEMMEI